MDALIIGILVVYLIQAATVMEKQRRKRSPLKVALLGLFWPLALLRALSIKLAKIISEI